MTNKDIFEDAFPQDKQVGGSHYKNKIEDLEKIKHYCDLEIKKLKDKK